MKKIIMLIAVIVGLLGEVAAVILAIHLRGKVVYGGEYLVFPMFVLIAYLLTEISDTIKISGKPEIKIDRMTRRTKYGTAVLSSDAFPKYAEECLIREMTAFEPFKEAVERLCTFEEANDVQK